jgi:hypothetical protein
MIKTKATSVTSNLRDIFSPDCDHASCLEDPIESELNALFSVDAIRRCRQRVANMMAPALHLNSHRRLRGPAVNFSIAVTKRRTEWLIKVIKAAENKASAQWILTNDVKPHRKVEKLRMAVQEAVLPLHLLSRNVEARANNTLRRAGKVIRMIKIKPTSTTGAGGSTTAPKGDFGSSMDDNEDSISCDGDAIICDSEGADEAGRLGGPSRNQGTQPAARDQDLH